MSYRLAHRTKCDLFAVNVSRRIIQEKKRAQSSKILRAACAVSLSRKITQEKKRAHSCKIWAQSSLHSHNTNADDKHTKMSLSDGQECNNGGLIWQYDA